MMALWCPFVKGFPANSAITPFVKGSPQGSSVGCQPFDKALNDHAIQASRAGHVVANVQLLGIAAISRCADKLGCLASKDPHDQVMSESLFWNSQPSPWMKRGMVFSGDWITSLLASGSATLVLNLLNPFPECLALWKAEEVLKGIHIVFTQL